MADDRQDPANAPQWWRKALQHIGLRRKRTDDQPPTLQQQIEDAHRYFTGRRLDHWKVERIHTSQKTGETNELAPIRLHPPIERQASDREAPYVLRGRDTEFSFLAQKICNMPHPIIAIEGAVGVGKTSLIQAASQYATHLGFLHIPIGPAKIFTRERFIHALRDTMVPKLSAALTLKPQSTSGIANLINNFGQAYQWEDDPNIICQQAVALAQDCGFYGILFTIDEAQKISKFLAEKDAPKAQDFAAPLFYFLNDEAVKATTPIPIACIIGGTYGTVEAAIELLSPRFARQSHIHLANVRDETITQIVNDRLNVIAADGTIPADVPQPIHQKIIDLSLGHLAHATALADTICNLAYETTRNGHDIIQSEGDPRANNPDSLYKTPFLAMINAMKNTYEARFNLLRTLRKPNENILFTFAYLEQRAGGPLTTKEAQQAARHLIAETQNSKPDTVTQDQIDTFMEHICRDQIITYINKTNDKINLDDDFVTKTYYTTPVPSFSQYLTESLQQDTDIDPTHERHRHYSQQAALIMPETRQPIQRWLPPEEPEVHPHSPISELPVFGPHNSQTLQKTLECDTTGTRLTDDDRQTLQKMIT